MPTTTQAGWDAAIGIEDDPVIASLRLQVVCYQRLAKLAEIQHEHVQQGATESLIQVLVARQEVLEEVARLEEVVSPARKRWGQYVTGLRQDQRQSADQLVAQTRKLLEEITTADRHDALILQQRKLNLGKQIQSASTARQVNRNYAVAAYGASQSKLDVKQ